MRILIAETVPTQSHVCVVPTNADTAQARNPRLVETEEHIAARCESSRQMLAPRACACPVHLPVNTSEASMKPARARVAALARATLGWAGASARPASGCVLCKSQARMDLLVCQVSAKS